ncbi:LysR family transcriptional regulator [Veillonella sp. YH-vei2232]|uniref:LysR family transcriptional regulator n=1 Tax=Veillonella absiana TaxID=3079305 RepID=A0ABU3ZAL2_9FIRM|nr:MULTISPECIES: LysR family transcriptional regulator [unclassified Veillonella]MDV5063934.1 LysR family transcriptional regulator [Veillonella sp. YH-vei2232]MDV5088727.1 LysR family transcriptional regulator [Veillonella sp. YH-vei2233]
MDTSYYHNFITLVQTGNMTQAAEILHITQPALSKQLKYLEAEFGSQLINIKRGQRGSNLQLTEAGKIFYEKAQQLCSIEESTYNAVKQLNSRIEGTLRIASSASRSTPIVQQYLPAFSIKHPSVRFEIYEGLMTNVVSQLINGSAEIGIANLQMVDTDKFKILLTQEEHLYALYRRDVFWTDREIDTISWEDIRQCPLSLSGGSVRMIVQTSLTNMEHLNTIAITTTKSSAIEWASSGRTVALVPMDQKEMVNHRKMMRIKLSEFSGDFKKAFITLKGHSLSPVAQQFVDFYKAFI